MGYCEKGLAILDQAIQLNLNNVEAYRIKGQLIEIFLDRNDDALAAYNQVTLLDPNFIIHKATFLFEIQRFDEAADAYNQAISHHPDDPIAHYMKGLSLLSSGRNEEALPCFEQVIRFDPNDAMTHHKMGKALFGCGRYEEALMVFKKAISLFDDTSVSSRYARYRHSESAYIDDIYAEMKKLFTGLEGFKDALEELKQCYDVTSEKINNAIRAMCGLDENEDVYDDGEIYDEHGLVDGLGYEGIPYDHEREEWEADIHEYAQDWATYTEDYN